MCNPLERIVGAHPNLEWAIWHENGACTITLTGELDMASCDQLESALSDSLQQDLIVIFDLEDLTFVDSTGLRLLIRWRENVLGWGGAFLLARPSAPARRLLQVAGVPEVEVMGRHGHASASSMKPYRHYIRARDRMSTEAMRDVLDGSPRRDT